MKEFYSIPRIRLEKKKKNFTVANFSIENLQLRDLFQIKFLQIKLSLLEKIKFP